MNDIKKFFAVVGWKKIQPGPSEWNCYFQWVWFSTGHIFKGQLSLLGICERRSRNYLISLLLGLITETLVIFLTNEDSSGSCFSQQLRELNACFREVLHDTRFLRNAPSPLTQRDQFLIILTNQLLGETRNGSEITDLISSSVYLMDALLDSGIWTLGYFKKQHLVVGLCTFYMCPK